MKKKRYISISLALLLGVLPLTGQICTQNAYAGSSAKLNYTKIWIQKGTNQKLKLKKGKKTKWSVTAGKGVVSLSSATATGVKVTARKPGTAVVTAKSGKKKYTCTVKVFTEPASKSMHTCSMDDFAGVIKRNHVLYDAKGKKVCADALDVAGAGTEGFWVLKVNHALYHYMYKGRKKYSGVKVLSGVKELTPGMQSMSNEPSYVVRTDGTVWKLTQKTKNDSLINRFKVKKFMSGVSHLYCGRAWTGNNNFALKKDGSLWGWGENEYGEMANGKTKKVSRPVRIMTNVMSFTCIEDSWGMDQEGNVCLAIKKDHTLWGWGFNQGGIPEGKSEKVTSPVKIMNDIVFVDGYHNIIVAIDKKKQLFSWGRYAIGSDSEKFLVTFTAFYPTKVADDVITADADVKGVFYIRSDKTLYGCDFHGETPLETRLKTKMKILKNVKAVKAFENFALTEDGTLWKFDTRNNKIKLRKKYMKGL